MTKNVHLSVIVPLYNEEDRAEDSLNKIIKYLYKADYKSELILVSDGSNDNTVKLIKNVLKHNSYVLKSHIGIVNAYKKNKGKGYAISQGFNLAKGKHVLFTDADLATPFEYVDSFMKFADQDFDIVIASRNLKNSKAKRTLSRFIIGAIFRFFCGLVIKGVKDTQCGFKLYKNKSAKKIAAMHKVDRFAFDVDFFIYSTKNRI